MPANNVDLWQFDLASAAYAFLDERELERILSPPEKARARQFANRSTAADYRLSMGLIRHALAGILHTTPDCVIFNRDAAGKPSVAGSGIFISYSHTTGFAALAVSQFAAVGVDAEPVRDFPEDEEIRSTLDVVFESQPSLEQAGVDSDLRNTTGWTVLEAITKAYGRPLGSLFSPEGKSWLRKILSTPQDFSLFSRHPMPNMVVSLCVRAIVANLQLRHLK